MMAAREENRLAYIDSLRAIAAMLVVWVHVSQVFKGLSPATAQSSWVNGLTVPINAGRIGVVTFFAISGFVIPFSIKLAHRFPVREFLLTRFFRLYPAYWLSIPFGAATLWLWNRPLSVSEFMINLTMLAYIFNVPLAIGLYWTLAVEFVFYMCCVALVLTGNISNYRRIGALVLVLIALHLIAVAATWKNGGPSYELSEWPLNLAVMFWGTLYRARMRGLATSRFETVCVRGFAFFIIVLYPLTFTYLVGVPPVHTIGYSLGVLIFVIGTRFIRIEIPPLPWLGVISYSIYLFHPVVFAAILLWLNRLPPDSWWRSWHLGFYVLAILAITIAVSALIYRFVERPSIRLGRRLAKAWFEKPEAIPAPVLQGTGAA